MSHGFKVLLKPRWTPDWLFLCWPAGGHKPVVFDPEHRLASAQLPALRCRTTLMRAGATAANIMARTVRTRHRITPAVQTLTVTSPLARQLFFQ